MSLMQSKIFSSRHCIDVKQANCNTYLQIFDERKTISTIYSKRLQHDSIPKNSNLKRGQGDKEFDIL